MRHLLLTALLGAALGLGACGGGEDEEGPAGAGSDPLSVPEYRTLLKTECEKSEREARALGEPEAATPEAIADYFDEVADLTRRKQKEFEAVQPPAEFGDRHREGERLGRQVIDLLDQVVEALREDTDPERVFSALTARLNTALRRNNEIVDEIGVPGCKTDLLPTGQTAPS
ncbi:MAG: hypothetical protein H0T43_04965 [Solirubrobacterales bacterium]|nr:hypothetical protein [Solirubrobacterales bacterium]